MMTRGIPILMDGQAWIQGVKIFDRVVRFWVIAVNKRGVGLVYHLIAMDDTGSMVVDPVGENVLAR
jgi:hypothetical protein